MKASWYWFTSFISVKFSLWCHSFLGGSVHFSNNETGFTFYLMPPNLWCAGVSWIENHLIDSLWFGNLKTRVFLCPFCCSLCGNARVPCASVPCLNCCDAYLPPSPWVCSKVREGDPEAYSVLKSDVPHWCRRIPTQWHFGSYPVFGNSYYWILCLI